LMMRKVDYIAAGLLPERVLLQGYIREAVLPQNVQEVRPCSETVSGRG
jgi:hypothetical protein